MQPGDLVKFADGQKAEVARVFKHGTCHVWIEHPRIANKRVLLRGISQGSLVSRKATGLIGRPALTNLHMVAGNEKRVTLIIDDGIVKQWASIGWIDVRPASDADYDTIACCIDTL